MCKPANAVPFVLLLLLTGCANPARQNTTHVPDWQSGYPAPIRIAAPATANGQPFAVQTSRTSAARPPTEGIRSIGNGGAGSADDSLARWVPLQRWTRESGLAVLSRLAGAPLPSFSLRSPQGTLVLRMGSLVAHWDGLELRLGFAPQLIGQQPFVHALDLQKTIQPLLQPPQVLNLNGVVVIDPGHGGADSGAASVLGAHYEKEYTLDWALRLGNLLTARGCQVLLTRSRDVEVPLADRVALAGDNRAALFISLHFNSAAPNHTEAGLETYCLTPAGMPSTLTRGYGEENIQALPNNSFDAENFDLAVVIHRSLLRVNGGRDRGVRRARFPAVLRGQQCPAVLIEGGYLSHPAEAQAIADPVHRQRLAEAVAAVVAAAMMRQ